MNVSIFVLVLTIAVLFCPPTEGIDCYSCDWSSPPISGSQAACEKSPTEGMLRTYPDSVDRSAVNLTPAQNVSSAEASALVTAIHAAIETAAKKETKSTNAVSGLTGSSRATYTTLCMTSFLQLSIQGQSAELIVREGFGLQSSSSYVNTCTSTYPPGLEEQLEEFLPYIVEKRFCYCNCDACNKDAITATTVPSSNSRDCGSSASKFIITYSVLLFSALLALL